MEDQVTAIANALVYGTREARLLAAREIGDVSTKLKRKMAETGVIPPLLLMLQSHDYEVTEAALLALLSLAFGSERNKVCIAKSGAIPLLLEILSFQNESLTDLAVAALLTLSSCTTNKLPIAASGAIQILVELLNSQDMTSRQAKLDIISTLHNLSTCSQIIPSVVVSGGVVSLLQLIHGSEKSSDVAEKAMALLEKMVSTSEIAVEEAAGTSGAIQVLVEAVEEGSMQCKEKAVEILVAICQRCRERYRGMILREGAMPGVLQLSVDGTRRAKEKARALLLLLRDRSDCESRNHQKKVIFEEAMREIDRDEKCGMSLRALEETIAKLRT